MTCDDYATVFSSFVLILSSHSRPRDAIEKEKMLESSAQLICFHDLMKLYGFMLFSRSVSLRMIQPQSTLNRGSSKLVSVNSNASQGRVAARTKLTSSRPSRILLRQIFEMKTKSSEILSKSIQWHSTQS